MALTKLSADSTRIYNEDLVTTAEAIHPGIIENAIDAHPGASIFLGNAGEILTGEIRAENGSGMGTAEAGYGESVRVNAKLGKNGSARRLSGGYSEFSSDGSDTARGTRANWKMYGATVQISGSQRRQNAGQGQVIDQLEYKIKDSSSALVDLVAEDLMTASSQPNSITSLNDVISAGGERCFVRQLERARPESEGDGGIFDHVCSGHGEFRHGGPRQLAIRLHERRGRFDPTECDRDYGPAVPLLRGSSDSAGSVPEPENRGSVFRDLAVQERIGLPRPVLPEWYDVLHQHGLHEDQVPAGCVLQPDSDPGAGNSGCLLDEDHLRGSARDGQPQVQQQDHWANGLERSQEWQVKQIRF